LPKSLICQVGSIIDDICHTALLSIIFGRSGQEVVGIN
jgi:hypothetical protein